MVDYIIELVADPDPIESFSECSGAAASTGVGDGAVGTVEDVSVVACEGREDVACGGDRTDFEITEGACGSVGDAKKSCGFAVNGYIRRSYAR